MTVFSRNRWPLSAILLTFGFACSGIGGTGSAAAHRDDGVTVPEETIEEALSAETTDAPVPEVTADAEISPVKNCCEGNGDCPEGQVCREHESGKVCIPDLVMGQCWTGDDCYQTQTCEGAMVCPCGYSCDVGTVPGSCTPVPAGCCNVQADCGEGLVCRAVNEVGRLPGRCVPDPNGPQCLGDAACCWEESDCYGSGVCQAALLCGCIELCHACGECAPDHMGYCE